MSQEDVSKQIETARRQLGAQRPDLAIQTLQAIVHQAPNEADARNLLGVAYSMTGNAQAAEASLRQALSLMPHNPDILSNLAQHLAAGKRFEEAGALWQQALRSRPDHTPSRVGLNQLDKMRDNAVEALDFVEAQEIGVSRATAGLARSHMILDELYAHRRSLELGVGVDVNEQPLPIYTYPAIEYLRQFDFADCRVLEWGGGNSTRWWAARSANVVAVEHDPEWVARLQKKMPENVELLARDTLEGYVECRGQERAVFDIIVVDGMYRFDCATQAPLYLKDGGMVVLDNSDWHPESARVLRDSGLIQVDFAGFKPAHDDVQTTSAFLHPSFRPKLLFGTQPLSAVGSRFFRTPWDRSYRS